MTDGERRSIQDSLIENCSGLWKDTASEIDFARHQVYFWFLIEDTETLGDSVDAVLDILGARSRDFPAMEFNAAFIQLTSQKKTDLETLDDGEIRTGIVDRVVGSAPTVRKRPEYTVFDRRI